MEGIPIVRKTRIYETLDQFTIKPILNVLKFPCFGYFAREYLGVGIRRRHYFFLTGNRERNAQGYEY